MSSIRTSSKNNFQIGDITFHSEDMGEARWIYNITEKNYQYVYYDLDLPCGSGLEAFAHWMPYFEFEDEEKLLTDFFQED